MKLSDNRVTLADDIINHLLSRVVETGSGSQLRDRYVGFCVVTATTHIETTAKEIILDFCKEQNQYLHAVISKDLKNFNAKISYVDLCKFLNRLDPAMEQQFKKMLNRLNKRTLNTPNMGFDLFQAYENLLNLRHSFVHNLHVNFSHVTNNELERYIFASKRIISAFGRSLAI